MNICPESRRFIVAERRDKTDAGTGGNTLLQQQIQLRRIHRQRSALHSKTRILYPSQFRHKKADRNQRISFFQE
jgi:hypothetical protein